MPGREALEKWFAISPAASTPRANKRSRISRRVGSAIAVKASLLPNDRPESRQMMNVPPLLVPFEIVAGLGPESFEAMMEDLHVGGFVQRCHAQRHECRHWPLHVGIHPVALERDFTIRFE